MSDRHPLPNAAPREPGRPTGAVPEADDQRRDGRRWPRRAPVGALLRGLLAFAIAWMGPASWISVGAQADGSLLEAQVRLARAYEPLEALIRGLDRTGFDLDALALDLAFEAPEDIVRIVHERVRFEPYHGILRGAEGTLVSAGGNAWDQALLTARLLGDAGYDVEVRSATLAGDLADRVWSQVGAGGDLAVQLEVVAAEGGWAEDSGAAAALEAEADRVLVDLSADTRDLDVRLASAVALEEGLLAQVRAAAAEYAWVAFRLGPDDPWQAAHSVLGVVGDALPGLEAEAVHVGAVPSELLHGFRFQAFLERKIGDRLDEVPVMDPWEAPVANLFGVPLNFAAVPDGLDGLDPGSDLDTIAQRTNFFFPMLRGDLAPGGRAFDLAGNTLPADAAASPFAALFATLGQALGGATSALGGLGGDGPAPAALALTAFGFDVTFVAPDGTETTHRRWIVDRLGAEDRAAGRVDPDPAGGDAAVVAALMSAHTFMLDPGRYGDAYVLGRAVEQLLAVRPYLDDALRTVIEGAPLPTFPNALLALGEPIPPLLLLTTFAGAPLAPDVVSYRPAPGFVVLVEAPALGRAEVDVVANPRWSLRRTEAGIVADAASTRVAGVWETRVESLPLARDDGEIVVPAFAAFDGAAFRTYAADDATALAATPYPRASQDAMQWDLDQGYVVVVPVEPGDGVPGWWRIDPVTGETLGRGADGRGNAFVEYLTSWELSAVITVAFTGNGVAGCMRISDGWRQACCVAQNVAMGAAGFGFGYALGAATTQAALKVVVFVKMDLQANLIGTLIPPVCGT